MQWFVENEAVIRLTSFVLVFAVMASWERAAAARPLRVPRRKRWPRNLGLTIFNTLLLRVFFPAGAVGAAVWAESRELGLMNALPLHPIAAAVVAFVMLDLAIWAQHLVFHAVPALFRLHRVHHADNDFDVTLGARFHPLEMILSMLIKVALVVALGAPPAAVVVFEVALNVMSMFNHSNVRLPDSIDRGLRWMVVTPGMHSVHHSPIVRETNSNFGFNLSWWDRVFGTYLQSTRGRPEIGLAETMRVLDQSIGWMLRFPFVALPPSSEPPAENPEGGTS